jgi:hypothetical protein
VAAPASSTERPLSMGVLFGAGFSFDHLTGSVNPMGFGLGVRAGYNLNKLFLGGRFMYYVGDASDLPTGRLAMKSWLLAAEGGYDLELGCLVLRPGLALGIASRIIDGPPSFNGGNLGYIPGSASNTQVGLYLAPGASLILPIDAFFVGADARLHLVLGDRVSGGLELLANAGMRF